MQIVLIRNDLFNYSYYCYYFYHHLLLSCMVGFAFVLDWKDVQEKCALHTLSRTWRLGNTVLRARHNKASPVDSILQHENGKLLIVGKV